MSLNATPSTNQTRLTSSETSTIKEQTCFPRTKNLPTQSPVYWVSQKDRYLRQQLIQDIEEETGRDFIVYFTNMSVAAQIQPDDIKYLSELLQDCKTNRIDLFLETQGGLTYGAESIISLLREKTHDLRVIVANCAKSNGTLISLASKEIVMGMNSQLGPFDPLISLNGQMVPAHYIRQLDPQTHPLEWQAADMAVRQSANIAQKLLKEHLPPENHCQIEQIVDALSTKSQFPDHSAVINAKDAIALGLQVNYLPYDNSLWKKLWLLYCMYDYDSNLKGLAKIFEGKRVSSALVP